MRYVIGIDLGTSSVKAILVSEKGEIYREVSKSYPLIQPKAGYSEQDPEEWVIKTKEALKELVEHFDGDVRDIQGISFSGQMHGLVLLGDKDQPIRNAILWNDTRTTKQCRRIIEVLGENQLYQWTKNPALEGFTLPKLLWVQEHEPENFSRIKTFLLPKDYLRFRMTNAVHSEYSDAAGTLLLDIKNKTWSREICEAFSIDPTICPPLVDSAECVGRLNEDFARATGLSSETKVFAGGADNACGAIGAGITSPGKTMCSIGTSGVILTFEADASPVYGGNVHFFNHAVKDAFYSMGVTLSAGYSLDWYKQRFASEMGFDELLKEAETVSPGSDGLLFAPYLVGERTPHGDARIRGSYIGIDALHERAHFTRAVLEGVTFSLNESIEILRASGKTIDTIVSIGGGAKSRVWLQIQADIFNARIIKLKSEQGPALGAAILAGLGCGWYSNMQDGVKTFVQVDQVYEPNPENVERYRSIFKLYQEIYKATKNLNYLLNEYRKA
jgi:xylulokinase